MSSLYCLYGIYFLLILAELPKEIKSQEQNQSMIERISEKLKKSTEIIDKVNQNLKLIKNTQTNLCVDLSDLESNIKHLNSMNELLRKDMQENSIRTATSFSLCSKMNENSILTSHLSMNCAEATRKGNFKNNMYLLKTSSSDLEPFCAYCILNKTDENIAWTVIQRREDGTENFNRNWYDYKNGFGDAYGEYWIGLERMHIMTKDQPHELWIQIEDYNGVDQHVKYSNFSIASESEGYRLTLAGYEGRVGDSLGKHNNKKFSTFDVNNDDDDDVKTNCARQFKGGWWYMNCYYCHLNGAYYSNSNQYTEGGINWNDWHGYKTSLKYTHMAIRPIF